MQYRASLTITPILHSKLNRKFMEIIEEKKYFWEGYYDEWQAFQFRLL